MPTESELKELFSNCTSEWTEQNGVNGYKLISKNNSNAIFLPAAGFYDSGNLKSVGSQGNYLSATQSISSSSYARYRYFSSSSSSILQTNKSSGFSIRAVCP